MLRHGGENATRSVLAVRMSHSTDLPLLMEYRVESVLRYRLDLKECAPEICHLAEGVQRAGGSCSLFKFGARRRRCRGSSIHHFSAVQQDFGFIISYSLWRDSSFQSEAHGLIRRQHRLYGAEVCRGDHVDTNLELRRSAHFLREASDLISRSLPLLQALL